MKNHGNKIFFFLTVLVLIGSDAFSQLEITPYTGFMFGGRGYGYYVDIKIDDGQNFGIMADIPLNSDMQVELMYNRMVSRAQVWDYREQEQEIFNIASEYFLAGALYQMDYGRLKPYAVILGGLAVHSPQQTNYNNKASFGLGLGAGIKIFVTDFLGIRLQGRLLMPLYVSGVGLGCGIGTGGASCGGGVGLSSTLLQGDFNAGIILRLPGKSPSSTY